MKCHAEVPVPASDSEAQQAGDGDENSLRANADEEEDEKSWKANTAGEEEEIPQLCSIVNAMSGEAIATFKRILLHTLQTRHFSQELGLDNCKVVVSRADAEALDCFTFTAERKTALCVVGPQLPRNIAGVDLLKSRSRRSGWRRWYKEF